MIILRQKNYGLISGVGHAIGHAVTGASAVGGLAGMGVGSFLNAHPVGTGLLAAYGLYKLIKRRRARRQGEYY